MCGIVGAVAQRDVAPILVEGLKRLEYRGYDSAGIATVIGKQVQRVRVAGKVRVLEEALHSEPHAGGLGIAHTRWATMACHPCAMRTRICVATRSHWYTTASSKTTSGCAPSK